MCLCSRDHECALESLGEVKMPGSWGYISRDSDLIGSGAAQVLVFYKSYPGDSNVHPKLRITSVECQNWEILWKTPG